MSECDCTPEAVCEEGEKQPSCWGVCFKFLPYALLIAAAALWFWDNQQKKERFEAVKTVVEKVTGPLKAVAIGQKVEGREAIVFMACPASLATNLLTQIAQAQPTKFPKNAEGTECEILLVQTNDVPITLRAVILDKDPEALYVGVKYSRERDEEGKVISWVVTPPVRAAGAGIMINEILNAIHNVAPTLIEKAEEARQSQPETEIDGM